MKASEGGPNLVWKVNEDFPERNNREMGRRVKQTEVALCAMALRQGRAPCVQGKKSKSDGTFKEVKMQLFSLPCFPQHPAFLQAFEFTL